jgi:hypothetical protein
VSRESVTTTEDQQAEALESRLVVLSRPKHGFESRWGRTLKSLEILSKTSINQPVRAVKVHAVDFQLLPISPTSEYGKCHESVMAELWGFTSSLMAIAPPAPVLAVLGGLQPVVVRPAISEVR